MSCEALKAAGCEKVFVEQMSSVAERQQLEAALLSHSAAQGYSLLSGSRALIEIRSTMRTILCAILMLIGVGVPHAQAQEPPSVSLRWMTTAIPSGSLLRQAKFETDLGSRL
jgi:hypothetical protein